MGSILVLSIQYQCLVANEPIYESLMGKKIYGR